MGDAGETEAEPTQAEEAGVPEVRLQLFTQVKC